MSKELKNLQKAIKAFETNGEKTPYEYSIGAHTQITFQFASNDKVQQVGSGLVSCNIVIGK